MAAIVGRGQSEWAPAQADVIKRSDSEDAKEIMREVSSLSDSELDSLLKSLLEGEGKR
jgi:hypothetical protein